MKLFGKTPNVPFVKYRHLFLAGSALIIAISLTAFFTRGLSYGIDFLGGVKLQYQFPKVVSEEEVRQSLTSLNLGDVSVVRFGTEADRRIIIKVPKASEASAALSSLITPKLTEGFGAEGLTLEQEEIVGPKVGQELRRKGTMAVLFSLVCMLIYIGFRFQSHNCDSVFAAIFNSTLSAWSSFAKSNISSTSSFTT